MVAEGGVGWRGGERVHTVQRCSQELLARHFEEMGNLKISINRGQAGWGTVRCKIAGSMSLFPKNVF